MTDTGNAAPLREDHAVVRCPRVEVPPVGDGEITHILGDDRPSFRHGQTQEIWVVSPTEVIAFGYCDDVVTPTAKLGSDSGIVMLVE